MKCLIAMYDKKDMGCLFFEAFVDQKDLPHCVMSFQSKLKLTPAFIGD